MPVCAERDGAPAPADGIYGAAAATAAEIAAGALAAAAFRAATEVAFRPAAAAAAWAAPATPYVAMGTARSLRGTMVGCDWAEMDRTLIGLRWICGGLGDMEGWMRGRGVGRLGIAV